MIYNQLLVLPTPDTLTYLSNLMSGSALDFDLSKYYVELMLSEDQMTAQPDRIYSALTLNVRVWYDPHTQLSSLILTLDSAEMAQRCIELHEKGVVRSFYNYFNPHIMMKQGMPPLSHHYKTAILQIKNALGSNSRPLYFGREFLTQIDLQSPPQYEYNEAMAAERGFRRNE